MTIMIHERGCYAMYVQKRIEHLSSSPSQIETRLMLAVKMGFVSLRYGFLVQVHWNKMTGMVPFFPIFKSCPTRVEQVQPKYRCSYHRSHHHSYHHSYHHSNLCSHRRSCRRVTAIIGQPSLSSQKSSQPLLRHSHRRSHHCSYRRMAAIIAAIVYAILPYFIMFLRIFGMQ